LSKFTRVKQTRELFFEGCRVYHDTGGVTWDRDTMISNTKKFACGNHTRTLIAESFKVYPIKYFGAK